MIVFKLERERPAYAMHGGTLYYVKDRYLRTYDYASSRDNPLISIRRPGAPANQVRSLPQPAIIALFAPRLPPPSTPSQPSPFFPPALSSSPSISPIPSPSRPAPSSPRPTPAPAPAQYPRSLSYNPAENAVLINLDGDGGSYELHVIPKDAASGRGEPADTKRGAGSWATFVARNRFAVLDKPAGQILIKNLRNEVTKKYAPPLPGTDAIFYAGTGCLLCRCEDKMVLFDVQQRSVMAELATPFVKYVVWSQDGGMVALLSKHAIVLANKRLGNACNVHETIRVKSGAWDDYGVFIYTTLNHIKYALPNGDSGIIRTLETPVYITKVSGSTVYCLDRDGRNRTIAIDCSEYLFKLALVQRKYDQVLAMIKSNALCGQSIIAYLQLKGFPEVALHFVKDERTRFNLAVECGNIEVALASAQEIDEKDLWHRLGVEALRQGNHQIVEFAYQRTKNFERLSFLYLITGNVEKLSKMLKIADMRGDIMGKFHNALYLGDARERCKILEESGQIPLAYATAATHGLAEDAARLAEKLESAGVALPAVLPGASLLAPPVPILRDDNWPLLTITKGYFDGGGALPVDSSQRDGTAVGGLEDDEAAGGAGWGDDLDLAVGGEAAGADGEEREEGAGDGDEDGGWEMEDLELPPEALGAGAGAGGDDAADLSVFVGTTPGVPGSAKWTQRSSLAGEHAAAGAFDTAMRLLNRQLGVCNFEPLKQLFLDVAAASHCAMPPLLGVGGASWLPVGRGWVPESLPGPPSAPSLFLSLPQLEEQLKAAYKLTTDGKFSEGLRVFQGILHGITLLVVETRKEVDDVRELVTVARDYTLALKIELKRKEAKDDPVRQAELAAYFTHCNLQPIHVSLSLRSAMSVFFKLKNFATAANFCRRLLELNPPANVAQQARQVLAACERTPKDEVELKYDARNPFVTCPGTFTPIYRGSKDSACPTCGAKHSAALAVSTTDPPARLLA